MKYPKFHKDNHYGNSKFDHEVLEELEKKEMRVHAEAMLKLLLQRDAYFNSRIRYLVPLLNRNRAFDALLPYVIVLSVLPIFLKF